MQLAHYLVNRDVEVIDWDLLTKREDATFLTYEITVKHCDAEKIQEPNFWPEGTRTRLYKPPTERRKSDPVNRKDKRGNNEARNKSGFAAPSEFDDQNQHSGVGRTLPPAKAREGGNFFGNMAGVNLPSGYIEVPSMPGNFVELYSPGNSHEGNIATGYMGRRSVSGSAGNVSSRGMETYPPGSVQEGNIASGHGNVIQQQPVMGQPVLNSWQLQYGNGNPGVKSLYVPTYKEPKQVRFLDRLGADSFVQQY